MVAEGLKVGFLGHLNLREHFPNSLLSMIFAIQFFKDTLYQTEKVLFYSFLLGVSLVN